MKAIYFHMVRFLGLWSIILLSAVNPNLASEGQSVLTLGIRKKIPQAIPSAPHISLASTASLAPTASLASTASSAPLASSAPPVPQLYPSLEDVRSTQYHDGKHPLHPYLQPHGQVHPVQPSYGSQPAIPLPLLAPTFNSGFSLDNRGTPGSITSPRINTRTGLSNASENSIATQQLSFLHIASLGIGIAAILNASGTAPVGLSILVALGALLMGSRDSKIFCTAVALGLAILGGASKAMSYGTSSYIRIGSIPPSIWHRAWVSESYVCSSAFFPTVSYGRASPLGLLTLVVR